MKICDKCKKIMMVDPSLPRTSIGYFVKCPSCGFVTEEPFEKMTMEDLGNHVKCPSCEATTKKFLEFYNKVAGLLTPVYAVEDTSDKSAWGLLQKLACNLSQIINEYAPEKDDEEEQPKLTIGLPEDYFKTNGGNDG